MLSKQALDQLIEDFILREGTDYGHSEYTLEQKKQQVINQMKAKHVIISYDPETESCTLIKKY
ncbi:MAG: YheU family protein [Bdellovibrionales bacterium]|nr:YheU family protein [Bdellovibrionales bacterium]